MLIDDSGFVVIHPSFLVPGADFSQSRFVADLVDLGNSFTRLFDIETCSRIERQSVQTSYIIKRDQVKKAEQS